jgi:hypothetical protein
MEPETTMTKIKHNRYELLNRCIPALQGPNDYVHKSCLAAIGLFPYPNNGKLLDLAQVINNAVAGHIRAGLFLVKRGRWHYRPRAKPL